jgi:hypothetical protein
MSAGVAAASLASRFVTRDLSAIFVCLGIVAGWGIAWLCARHVPREAS